jgi:hypothetical protein
MAVDEENKDLVPMEREILNMERVLVKSSTKIRNLPINEFRVLQTWIVEHLFNHKVMKLNHWLSVAFNLQKQRWGSDLDYLEMLPMPKILAFIEVQAEFYKDRKS